MPLPTAGEKIAPINYGTGPAHVVMNLRLTKTFGFGPKISAGAAIKAIKAAGWRWRRRGWRRRPRGPLFGGGPTRMASSSDRRYNLTFGVPARNVFNKVNLGNPSGILGSRFFDTPTGFKADLSRRVRPTAASICR